MKKVNFDWKWFVGVGLSLASVVVAGVNFYSENQSETLCYKIISAINVGDIGTESFGDLKFKYNNKIIDSGSIVSILIENKSKNPIRSKDFEEPISIVFNNVKVLDSSVKEAVPSNIRINLSNIGDTIKIQPTLLNSKDKFVIDILTDGVFTKLSVTGRIAGVSSIDELKEKDNETIKTIFGCLFVCIAFYWIFLFFSIYFSSYRHKNHMAIHMLSYSFFVLYCFSFLSASLAMLIGFAFLGITITFKNSFLSSFGLFGLAFLIAKLLKYNASISFSEKEGDENEKHRFFEIALDDQITVINPDKNAGD